MNTIKEKLIGLTSLIIRLFSHLPPNTSIIILNGGLGNQLFQLSLALHLKQKYSKKILFYDFRNEYKVVHPTSISKILDNRIDFLQKNEIPKLIRITIFSKYFIKLNNWFFKQFNKKLFPLFLIDHPLKNINLTNNLISSSNLSIFIGTWHSTINSYDKKIFSSLNISKNILISNTKKRLCESEFISLHIRRGDYISEKKALNYHGSLSEKYYLKSINFIRSNYQNLPVFIFTDDPKWVRKNFKPLITNSILISSSKQSAEVDFLLMTKAKYFIISNSTFSWWAAFISSKKSKLIIVPKQWFKNAEINSNLIYKDWSYKVF